MTITTMPKRLGEACRLTPILAEMRKALAACGVVAIALIAGCDSNNNYDLLDCRLRFDYADIRMMDGTTKTVRVAAWSDASNKDTIRITDTDGVSWLVHLNNVILRSETNTWERETP